MADLTKARALALYQILEVPYVSTENRLDERGLLVDVTDNTGDPYSARTKIDAWLTAQVYSDADIQTALETLLDSWIALGHDHTRIEGGNVGNVAGLYDDPDRERDDIRSKVLVIVPFWRSHLDIQSKQDRFVPVIR